MKRKTIPRFVLSVALTLAGTAIPAGAATITPVSATSPFQWFVFSGSDDRSPTRTIDGSGLDGFGQHTEQSADPQAWLADAAHYGSAVGPTITWDLGGIYDLTSMRIWNYNEVDRTEEGIRDVAVFVSNDGMGFTLSGNYTLASAPGVATYLGDTYSLTATARYVRFDVLSVQDAQPFGPHAGLSEIRFEGSATPEPSTFALLGLSTVVIGLARRGIATREK